MPVSDIAKFPRCRIMVIGDLMIDEYVWGTVDRISPEAPVPVVTVDHDEYTLGGAGNVVNNIIALGAQVRPVGVIGNDSLGERLLKKFQAMDIDTAGLVIEKDRPTTRKTRIIASHQQVLRVDREFRKPLTDESNEKLFKAVADQAASVDAVVVSDYGKGVVTAELIRQTVQAAAPKGIPVIVDPKGMDFTRYAGASLVTPNRKEAGLAAGIEIEDDIGMEAAARKLMDLLSAERLLITCGKDGMVLFERDREPYRLGANTRQVFDVSGAGDTVAAVIGLGLAAGADYPGAMTLANTAAGLVVAKVGTATVTPAELIGALQTQRDTTVAKVKSRAEIADICADLRRKGKTIVFTNGCFDLLHVGHIRFISAAKELGDVLIVALDDDASVRRLKGPDRPVITAGQRVRIVSALDVVDYVVIFDSDDLKSLIDAVKPDILAKGSNYEGETIIGRGIVEDAGGKVALIPIDSEISSARIIESIRNKKKRD